MMRAAVKRVCVVMAVLMLGAGTTTGYAQTGVQFEVVGKAEPDEWFNGVGQPYVPLGQQEPDAEGQPKVNQDYVWGMTQSRGNIWFGTVGNAACQALGVIVTEADLRAIRVCELGESQFPGIPLLLRRFLGDWRPPEVFLFDTQSQELIEMTPDDDRIHATLGLRSAGATEDVVLLAGPHLTTIGINLFAFDATTGEYLGSRYMFQYSDIRSWVFAQGELYTTVLNTLQLGGGGAVLRWRGTREAPFQFETVGRLDNQGAYIAEHDDRLFVTTWPSVGATSLAAVLFERLRTPNAGLWMSPKLSSGGLRPRHSLQWRKVWDAGEFEPDSVIARSYGGGALASFGDELYWGTMHFPGAGFRAFVDEYGQPDPDERETVMTNTDRRAIVLRGRGFDSEEETQIDLLYGDSELPRFTPETRRRRRGTPGEWEPAPNLMGEPLFGGAGFGNRENRYIWSMVVHQGCLYVGTFDPTFLFFGDDYIQGISPPPEIMLGADLWVFPAPGQAAEAVDQNGVGNVANHGVRNMVSTGQELYIGTANLANLLTDPEAGLPVGGWELIRVHDPNE